MAKKVGPYMLKRIIGKGKFGTVYAAYDEDLNREVAVKAVDRRSLTKRLEKQMEREVNAMRQAQSEYIVKLYDVKTSQNNVYLVMEYCPGGDLDDYIEKNGRVSERVAKKWICQLLSAFVTLQANHILHRDLKLANLLLSSPDVEQADIKLADFGFARILTESSLAQSQLGTPLFMAPEIFNREDYNFKVDVWSLGVLSYELLTGVTPFDAVSLQELKDMQKEPLAFPDDCGVSEEAKDFVRLMLTYDSARRPSFSDLQSHVFLNPVTPVLLVSSVFPAPIEIEEAVEEESIEDCVFFTEEIETEEHRAQRLQESLLRLTYRNDEMRNYMIKAEKYEDKNELIIAYAFYQKFTRVERELMADLNLLKAELISFNPEETRTLISDIEAKTAEVKAKIVKLETLLAMSVLCTDSYIVVSAENEFNFDEEQLLLEVDRVFRCVEGSSQEAIREVCLEAEELLRIVLEANPNNERADELLSEVTKRFRTSLAEH